MKTRFLALMLILFVLTGFAFAQDPEREKELEKEMERLLKEKEAAKNQASEEAKNADAEKKSAEAKLKATAMKIFITYKLIKNLDQPLKDYAYKEPFGRFPEASEEEDGNGTSNLVEQLRDNGFYQFNDNNLTDNEPYQLVDAWGNPMRYQSWKGKKHKEGAHNRKLYDLWSAGPDGDFETLVDNVDNWSWINSDEIKLEDIEKHLKVIADSNEIEEFFAEYFKAVNSYEIEKSLEFYYIPEDRLADFKRTASSQMEVMKKMFGEQEFLRNFKLVALVLEENTVKVTYKSDFYNLDYKRWSTNENVLDLVKIDGKWKIDIYKIYKIKSVEEIWYEAGSALEQIIDALAVFSEKSKGLGALASDVWKPISHILGAIELDSAELTDLENFDLDDFYYITRTIDDELQFRVICVAWIGEKGGSSGKGPGKGWKMYDSEKDNFSEDYKAVRFDGFKKSAKVEEKVKPEEKPEKTEKTEKPEPKDEISKEIEKQIAKVLQKFVDSFNARDIEKLLSCFYASNEDIQKKIDANFIQTMEAFEIKYKDVEKPLKDPKVLEISTQQEGIYKVTYIIEDYNGLDKDVKRKMLVIEVDGAWLIDVFGVYSLEKTMQKMFWKEAKTALGAVRSAIGIHKAKNKGELPDIFSYEWKKLSEILGKIKFETTAFNELQYFDADDFWYRTFSYKDGNFFEIICLANMGSKGGTSGKGPKKGCLIYDERENKWTKDFSAVEYDELKPAEKKPDEEPKKVPGDGKEAEKLPEPEDDDEPDAERKIFEELFTKFFNASNTLNTKKFIESIFLPIDSAEEYTTNVKTYFAELKKSRNSKEEKTFRDWKVLTYTLEDEYAGVTVKYNYLEDGEWFEEELEFICVKQERGWVVDVYDFYEIPEKPSEVPDDGKEQKIIAELEKTIEELKNEIDELKAENKRLEKLLEKYFAEKLKPEIKGEKAPEEDEIRALFDSFCEAVNKTDVDEISEYVYLPKGKEEVYKKQIREWIEEVIENAGEETDVYVKDWKLLNIEIDENVAIVEVEIMVFDDGDWKKEKDEIECVKIDKCWYIDMFELYDKDYVEPPPATEETIKSKEMLQKTIESMFEVVNERNVEKLAVFIYMPADK